MLSRDGAAVIKFTKNTPPVHCLCRYVDNQKLAGYGALGTMLPGGDGYYYGFVNIAGASFAESGVVAGNCPFRTDDLGSPGSFRGWDGSGYTVKWRSPYLPGGAGATGRCASLPTNNTSPFDAHVCLRRLVDGGAGGASAGFVAVGPHSSTGGVRYTECAQPGGEHFEHCASGDASRWSPIVAPGGGAGEAVLSLQSASRWQVATAGEVRVLYPVLLDHGSPALGDGKAAAAAAGGGGSNAGMWREDGDNYALTSVSSGSLWLYFVTTGHNVLRRRVRFTTAPEPPAPPPPPPLREGCTTVAVAGAGLAAANGEYTRLAGRAVFSKDTGHQIYAVSNAGSTQWHLAQHGVAGSVVYAVADPAAVRHVLLAAPFCATGGRSTLCT